MMRKIHLIFYFLVGMLSINNSIAQQNVGIGITSPNARLHLHQNSETQYTALGITNSSTGTSINDGLQVLMNALGDAQIMQLEPRFLTLGTSGLGRLNIFPNGKMGINTLSTVGSSDITIQTLNPTGYGGMYIRSNDSATGKPFYGYSLSGGVSAWHYYDAGTSSWRLYVGGERMSVYNDGKIAIGTEVPHNSAILDIQSTSGGVLLPRMTTTQRNNISSPAAGLLVYDNTNAKPYIHNGTAWETFGGTGLWSQNSTPAGIFYDGGNLGIGITSQFFSRMYTRSGNMNPIAGYFESTYTGSLASYGLQAKVLGSSGAGTRYAVHGQASPPDGNNSPVYGVYGWGTANGTSSSIYGVYGIVNGTGTGPKYGVYGLANGVGSYGVYGKANDPEATAAFFEGLTKVDGSLNVGWSGADQIFLQPNAINASPRIQMRSNAGITTLSMRAKGTTTTGSEIRMSNQAGVLNLFLKAENYPGRGASIYVKNHLEASTVEIHGDYNNTGTGRVITDELEIKGGSDLAEYFDSKDKSITPGSVVCIDPDNPGMVLPAGAAYDKKVVGVVSGANGIKPGMMMGQQGSIAFGNVPVAIAGRVYVRVDESNGPVEPGDFLTTADDGKAMRVTDWDAARGAIVGKALTRADENGYVLALVHLQ